MKKESTNDYLELLERKLSNRKVVAKPLSSIINFPLPKGQCFYLLDYKQNKIVYQKNIKEVLGYLPEEFTVNVVVNYIHPDDMDMTSRLIKATLMFAIENNVSEHVGFFLTYRIRHKNGNYIKVLRQSNVFDHDKDGKIISNLSMLSDVSFLNLPNRVEWNFEAPGLDKVKFKKYVSKAYSDFFSEREIEILKLLKSGSTSIAIANKLNISKHTVDTHRRNMLKKANCDNTIDLINFCHLNGLI